MQTKTRWLAATALLLAVSFAPSLAQTPVATATGPAPELTELNRSLQEIAAVLRELLDAQQIDHLMKRVQLQRDSLAPLEEELRRTRSSREGTAEQIQELTAHQTFLEEVAQENPESIEDYRIESRQIELQIKVLAAKLEPLEQRIFDMENDLRGRQAEIRDWEDLLDDALGLR